MYFACLLSFATGFLSLGQEILWVRLFSFANHSLPQSFAFVLTSYLVGIAIGAYIGKKCCSIYHDLWQTSAFVLFVAGLFNLMSPWVYAACQNTPWQIIAGGILIFLTALLTAIIFPIAHHLGAPANGPAVGRSVSRVYVSNIIGATLGPIVMSVVFLSVLTTQQCFLLNAGLTLLVSLFCLYQHLKLSMILTLGTLASVIIGLTMTVQPHLLIASLAYPIFGLHKIIETRQGIVTSYNTIQGDDVIFGSNVYDGRTNLDPMINTNGINRLIVLAPLQKKPERVLMIGLSVGTWLTVISGFPGVKSIDVVEINPGYLELIKQYPPQLRALNDPRVHVYIDDGRRWLKTHPDNQYDLIVMNTTYYWRAYTSNLLSREFLTHLKQHMRPGAILSYNTTSSPDAFKTATSVFSYAYRYENFVIAADFDWRGIFSASDTPNYLMQLTLDGRPLFPKGSDTLIQKFLAEPLVPIESVADDMKSLGREPLEVVTDHNLITEYKYGKSLNNFVM